MKIKKTYLLKIYIIIHSGRINICLLDFTVFDVFSNVFFNNTHLFHIERVEVVRFSVRVPHVLQDHFELVGGFVERRYLRLQLLVVAFDGAHRVVSVCGTRTNVIYIYLFNTITEVVVV